jgi:hypothetical protein
MITIIIKFNIRFAFVKPYRFIAPPLSRGALVAFWVYFTRIN